MSNAARVFGNCSSDPNWEPRADVNIDNFVDGLDITVMARNYGKQDS